MMTIFRAATTVIEITNVVMVGSALPATVHPALIGAGIGYVIWKAIERPRQDAILDHIKKEVRR